MIAQSDISTISKIAALIFCLTCITGSAVYAENYQVYGRLNPFVDVANGNDRYWATVLKIRNLTTDAYLPCFPPDKSQWSQIWADYDYSLINLTRTDGQDDCYIDYPLTDDGYKQALLQLLNHTHRLGRWLQNQGHTVQIKYYPMSPIDYLQRSNNIPIGVRVSTPSYYTARQNKLQENLDILDCAITQTSALSVPMLSAPENNYSMLPTLLSWSAVSGATKYNIQISTASDFSTILNNYEIADTSKAISGLYHQTDYYWRVLAINDYGMSKWSETRHFSYKPHFVRLRSTDVNYSGTMIQLYELKLYTEQNQAGTQFNTEAINITASSKYSTNIASYAFDNNTSTQWQSSTTTPYQWIRAEFQNPKLIKSFSVTTMYAIGLKFPKSFVLEVSISSDFSVATILGNYTTINSGAGTTTQNFNVTY